MFGNDTNVTLWTCPLVSFIKLEEEEEEEKKKKNYEKEFDYE
jgi:hypothetical protein